MSDIGGFCRKCGHPIGTCACADPEDIRIMRGRELAYVAEFMTTLRRLVQTEDRDVIMENLEEFTGWLTSRRTQAKPKAEDA